MKKDEAGWRRGRNDKEQVMVVREVEVREIGPNLEVPDDALGMTKAAASVSTPTQLSGDS